VILSWKILFRYKNKFGVWKWEWLNLSELKWFEVLVKFKYISVSIFLRIFLYYFSVVFFCIIFLKYFSVVFSVYFLNISTAFIHFSIFTLFFTLLSR